MTEAEFNALGWEWQLHGNDEWVFGKKVRGAVREEQGFAYYDEDANGREGGWRWRAFADPGVNASGVCGYLWLAMQNVERALGLDPTKE